MGWFTTWWRGKKATAVPASPSGGQTSMTLEERMAFRRQMVLDSAREVMTNHGLLSGGYRVSAARLDARGHQYAVMVDLLPADGGRVVDSVGERHAMEARMVRNARQRYKIKVTGVYWRVPAETERPATAVAPSDAPKPVFMRRSTDHAPEAGFPDTLVQARPAEDEGVSPEELAAFEKALNAGASPMSVNLGRRTYDTDFTPLN